MKYLITMLVYSVFDNTFAATAVSLQQAYPDFIQAVTPTEIIWTDGHHMRLHQSDLFNQLNDAIYQPGIPKYPKTFNPQQDPGRIRYEPFFQKMYGRSPKEIANKLTIIYWMPKIFGLSYPLQVTTINHVHQKLIKISQELETLVMQHPKYQIFLDNPGGTYCWRFIANTHRLSLHSFGIAIDINANVSNYWQSDLKKAGLPITENTPLTYKNNIPWKIILIFEKYGFIWGGKWHHYDSMHFEYRPEMIARHNTSSLH